MLKIGIITQARTGSTRLPGKILKTIKGKTLLQYHLDRIQRSGHTVVVATTVDPKDDVIVDFCKEKKFPYYRGSEDNVLSRYLEAARQYEFDVIVRVTSDCPLIDPDLVNLGIQEYLALKNERAYLSNCVVKTYARGFYYEIFSRAILEESAALDTSEQNQEHVTPYLYLGKAKNIPMIQTKQSVDHSYMRVVVDEENDFKLIKVLIEDYRADELNAKQIEQLFLDHPELLLINKDVMQKELKT
jgi:spore coat polysaccharide biosynthesis protein SpsF